MSTAATGSAQLGASAYGAGMPDHHLRGASSQQPGTSPSACPPLTAPAVPAVSPGFVPDRLRTTFAPRIGKPGQDACRATTAEAGQHTHPSGHRAAEATLSRYKTGKDI
jgi:hypothetical protein